MMQEQNVSKTSDDPEGSSTEEECHMPFAQKNPTSEETTSTESTTEEEGCQTPVLPVMMERHRREEELRVERE